MSSAQLGVILQHLQRMRTVQSQSMAPDGQLLEAFRLRRDEAAFAELVRRHGPMVLNVCRGVLHNLHDAEDVFQATFLVLAQKAERVRQPEAVGNWLCGVAYHLALKVRDAAERRRRLEERTEERMAADPLLDMTLRELHQVLLEELQHLPEKYRLPLILCYLEGRTQTEASRQLGWNKEVLRGRLNRGRSQLRARLTRRGLTLSAGVFVSALSGGTASALPAVRVEAAVKAALASATGQEARRCVSDRVAALAEGAASTLAAGQGKIATILVLVLGTLIAGAGLWARHPLPAGEPAAISAQPTDTPPAPSQPKGNPAQQRPKVASEEKSERIAVSGRVLAPDGKPVAGAEVTLWWHLGYEGYYRMWHPRTVRPLRPRFGAVSDADGRFRFTFALSEIDDGPMNMWEGRWKSAQVVAAVKGYGPGWVLAEDIRKGELTIRLVEDNVPIKGRIVDLQGRPVAGARVRVICLEQGGDFIKDFLWQTSWTGLSTKAPTDEAGMFTLTGLGVGRKALVVCEGPTIAHQFASIDTSVKADKAKGYFTLPDVVVKPTKPIVGTIRAKDTGKPLAGVVVYGGEAWNAEGFRREVRAITDANGHYRLVGLPKASQYPLTVYCPESQSYLGTFRRLADSEGLKPIAADFELRRGIPVAFRMLDKETRQPVRGTVQYTPLQSNSLYSEAEWSSGLFPNREFDRIHMPDSNGVFRLVVYPGPGIITAWAKYGRLYLPARPTPAEMERYIKGAGILGGFLELSEGYRIFDTDKTDKLLTFDIELDPGRTVKGSLLGPDGQPVKGATACGLTYHPHYKHYSPRPKEQQLMKTEAFAAVSVDAHTPRTLAFVHKDRKLIGHVVLHGDEKNSLVVRLQSWGALTGRIVDAEGKPLSDVSLHLHYPSLPAPGLGSLEQEFKTDRAGRFRVEGLLPGLKHELTLSGNPAKKIAFAADDQLKGLSARAGEVKDLGDIAVKMTPPTGLSKLFPPQNGTQEAISLALSSSIEPGRPTAY